MNIYTIYKATNKTNGKCYIGFDSNWPNRIKNHSHKYKKTNTKFYDSIKKHGWENFVWEVIYQSKDLDHCLNKMETHFICEYRTYHGFSDCNGYNMTLGGESPMYNRKHSNETLDKMSKSHIGIKCVWSEKIKEKHRQKYIENGTRIFKECPICKKDFFSPKFKHRICCSNSCAATYRNHQRKK